MWLFSEDTFSNMGYCKSLPPVTKSRMDFIHSHMGYVFGRYCWINIFRPEDCKGLFTGKWPDKNSSLKKQLAKWIEIFRLLILLNEISSPMCKELTAKRPGVWHVMVHRLFLLINEISSPIRKEPIARSPGDCHLMDSSFTILKNEARLPIRRMQIARNTEDWHEIGHRLEPGGGDAGEDRHHQELHERTDTPKLQTPPLFGQYSILLEKENHNVLSQDVSRYIPHHMVTSGGGWYLALMEAAMDTIDQSGRCLGDRNPEVYPIVSEDFVHGTVKCVPTVFRSYLFNGCWINIEWKNEEWHYIPVMRGSEKLLFCNQKLQEFAPNSNLKYSENVCGIVPEPSECYSGTIYKDHQDLKYQPSTTYKSDLNTNLPGVKNSVELPLLNNGTKHGNHQNLKTRGRTNRDSTAVIGRTGHTVVSCLQKGLPLMLACAMLQTTSANPMPTIPLQQGHQVNFEIVYDSNNHLNCTLKTDNGYFWCNHDCNKDAVQHQNFNSSSVNNALKTFCKEQSKDMAVNLKSVKGRHNLSSGNLHLNITWELNEDVNVTNVTTQYIVNGRDLTNDEIADLPRPISAAQEQNLQLSANEFKKEIDRHVTQLWERFREVLLPFLQRGDEPGPPEATTSSHAATICVPIIALAIIFAVIFVCVKYPGKTSCKRVCDVILCRRDNKYNLATEKEYGAEDDASNKEPLTVSIHVATSDDI